MLLAHVREESYKFRICVFTFHQACDNAFLSVDHLRDESCESSLVFAALERQDYIDACYVMMARYTGLVSEAKHFKLLFDVAIDAHCDFIWPDWPPRTRSFTFLLIIIALIDRGFLRSDLTFEYGLVLLRDWH